MKIQYLTVIFILIILPIVIVFSEYMNTQMELINIENIYDARLLDSTYDTIKAFQISTLNTMYYTPQTRIANIDGAVNTFFNSLITAFKYDGNKSSIMKEYVPAIVFTLYDGYYVYSPFRNELTNVKDEIDDKYEDNKNLSGLKPYVSYSCKYKYNGKEYIITYSLDNYIIVDVFDTSSNNHEIRDGYLLNVSKSGDNYIYAGITFTPSETEVLSEILPEKNEATGKLVGKKYYYTVRDAIKYYYGGNNTNISQIPADDDKIFYLDNSGNKINQVSNYKNNKTRFNNYYEEIFRNNTGYQYYKEAYDFTNWLLETEGLKNLTTDNIDKTSPSYDGYNFVEINNGKTIFNKNNIEDSDSNFNRHRADVIRAVITTNLSTSISGFSKYSSSGEEFIMPKISEIDWELLENNVCIATFLQGLRVGGKAYNNYAVVPNNSHKEYVDENDIYILKNDNTYAKVNDSTITDSNLKTGLGYQPGILKINLEDRVDAEGNHYYLQSYPDNSVEYKFSPYLQSYTSISGSSKINGIATADMYKYIRGETKKKDGTNIVVPDNVKKAYLIAIGRERKGSFKYLNDNIE